MSAAIQISGLGKRYQLGGGEPYQALRDQIASLPGRLLGRNTKRLAAPGHIWALKDLDLTVAPGEVLGIIGGNGAGKSTLLKILSRITTPTKGTATIDGRVGALLEVGTGFHPELTGRENVYVNGVILGMSKADIQRKFDEIVAFSGVEEFLDTPVKRYSSGMRVRLAFAVAAHLEPEILVIDEVLAVGDAAFQKKCLGRMADVSAEGRTILFVSHQMESIMSLCSRVVLLEHGKVSQDGAASTVVQEYLRRLTNTADKANIASRTDRSGSGLRRVVGMEILGDQRVPAHAVAGGEDVTLELLLDKPVDSAARSMSLNIVIRDQLERIVLFLTTDNFDIGDAYLGKSRLCCTLPHLALSPGNYFIDYSLRFDNDIADKMFRAATFEVIPGDFYGSGRVAQANGAVTFHACRWNFEE